MIQYFSINSLSFLDVNLVPFEKLLSYIDSNICIPKKYFLIFGSGPMYPFGLKLLFRDIDIVVNKKGWYFAQKFKQKTDKVLVPYSKGAISFLNGRIEVFTEWKPGGIADPKLWNTKMLFETSHHFFGYNFAHLTKVLLYKKMLNRPKDTNAIAVIERYLATSEMLYSYSPSNISVA